MDIRTTGNQDAGNQETRQSGRIALITRYSDNHCLVTRYPDAHYFYAKQTQFAGYSNERKLLFYNELRTNNYEQRTKKQTQTNPTCSELACGACPACPEPAEGSKVEPSNLFQTPRLSRPFLAFTFLCPIYNLAMQNWTIQKLLNWVTEHFTEKGIDSPRLSAELLLSHILGMKRIELYTQFDKLVSQQQLDQLHDLVKRAGQYEPIAYLTGKTEFYSLRLNVTPDCMIPRPETELLVERAIEFLRTRPVRNFATDKMTRKENFSNGGKTGRQFICDLCTGCGCIAVAIAKNYPDADIIATDISDAALSIAANNIEKHKLKDRIKLLCGDLFDPIMPQLDVNKFDLIVCNPPYTTAAEFESLEKNIKAFEPRIALYAGEDGLDVYRKIVEKVDRFLKPDAAIMLEIGYAQGQAVRELLEQVGCFGEIAIEKDYHNNDRIVTAIKKSS